MANGEHWAAMGRCIGTNAYNLYWFQSPWDEKIEEGPPKAEKWGGASREAARKQPRFLSTTPGLRIFPPWSLEMLGAKASITPDATGNHGFWSWLPGELYKIHSIVCTQSIKVHVCFVYKVPRNGSLTNRAIRILIVREDSLETEPTELTAEVGGWWGRAKTMACYVYQTSSCQELLVNNIQPSKYKIQRPSPNATKWKCVSMWKSHAL